MSFTPTVIPRFPLNMVTSTVVLLIMVTFILIIIDLVISTLIIINMVAIIPTLS